MNDHPMMTTPVCELVKILCWPCLELMNNAITRREKSFKLCEECDKKVRQQHGGKNEAIR